MLFVFVHATTVLRNDFVGIYAHLVNYFSYQVAESSTTLKQLPSAQAYDSGVATKLGIIHISPSIMLVRLKSESSS